MAQASRVYLTNAAVWNAGGTDFLARLKSASIKLSVAVQENSAILDPGVYPHPGKKSASLEWSEAEEGTSVLVPGEYYAFTGEEAGGSAYSGTFLMEARSQDIAEDGVSRAWSGTFTTLTIDGITFY
jgi:hypothetical protein